MATRIDNISVTTSGATASVTGKCDFVKVTNIDGGGIISFRIDGTTASDQADENFVIPALKDAYKIVSVPRGWAGDVSLDASATTAVLVECIDK